MATDGSAWDAIATWAIVFPGHGSCTHVVAFADKSSFVAELEVLRVLAAALARLGRLQQRVLQPWDFLAAVDCESAIRIAVSGRSDEDSWAFFLTAAEIKRDLQFLGKSWVGDTNGTGKSLEGGRRRAGSSWASASARASWRANSACI